MRRLWLLALLLGCSSTPKRGDTTTDPRCGPFRWSDAKHGALLVDVELGGVPGTFQVDTGLDVTSVYGGTFAKAHGLRVVRLEERTKRFARPSPHRRYRGRSDSGVFINCSRKEADDHLSGGVGMDVFFGCTVTIDHAESAPLHSRRGAAEQEASFDFVPLRTVGRNRIQPELTLGDRAEQRIAFDTGSIGLWRTRGSARNSQWTGSATKKRTCDPGMDPCSLSVTASGFADRLRTAIRMAPGRRP